jgi:FlaA1/EpsC-like NDP-sugar epimerase
MDNQIKNKDAGRSELLPVAPPLLRYRKPLILLAHIITFAVSLMLSFLLANNMQFKYSWLVNQYPILLFFFIIVKTPIFGFFKQYRGWWRYVSISDLTGIIGASLVSTCIVVASWYILLNTTWLRRNLQFITEVSQGVLMADMFTTVLLLAGLRMATRLYFEEFRTIEVGGLKRLLIVGAGNTGEALLREIHRMPVAQYDVIGFIDDDPLKQGIDIHGIAEIGRAHV